VGLSPGAQLISRVGCGAVTGCTADRQMIRVDDVRLLPPRNYLLSSRTKIREAEELV
jgi:hypothetical protein